MSIEERPSNAMRVRPHATRAPTPARDSGTPDALAEAAATFGVPAPRTAVGQETAFDRLDPETLELREHAIDTIGGSRLRSRDDRAWDPSLDSLTTARNAHRTNTADEMHDALGDDYNWLEGDVRLTDDDEVVMAHDAEDREHGLTLERWLAIGADGARGLKLDLKDHDSLPAVLDALEVSGIPDGRIMVNVGELPLSELGEIRKRFPDAWIALNPTRDDDDTYSPDSIARITELADQLGGRITFPIRWDIATDDVIQALKPHGSVSIWTSRTGGTPNDTDTERQRLLDRGVDGMIDLGEPAGFLLRIGQWALDLWNSDPVDGVRELVDDAGERLEEAADGIRDGARRVRDGVARLFD